MRNVKWCVYGCLLLLSVFKLMEAKEPIAQNKIQNITDSVNLQSTAATSDENIIISDEDRRGPAEKVKNKEGLLSLSDHKKAETSKRGIYLAAKHRIPGSLISPALRVTYKEPEVKEPDSGYGASSQHSYEDYKSVYPDLGQKTGYEYYTSHYPAEYGDHHLHTDGAAYGHTDNNIFGHTESGVYEYPAPDYTPSTGLGFENFKKSFGFKKFLLPLAGLALLGAAAALTVNPVLLQLGAITGKRRRRSLPTEEIFKSQAYPSNEFVRPDKVRKLRKS